MDIVNTTAHPGFRIFVLGAGFSRPAGLPLAPELFPKVREKIEGRYGFDTQFTSDYKSYLEYRTVCEGVPQDEDNLDLEAFMSYLDIEHFLELRGSDTWSEEGNESQLMIRQAIGQVIHSHTPSANELPDVYYRFAESLSLRDTVLTLNYDLVLERALEHVGKPYRLYPNRYNSVGRSGGEVDSDVEEVVVLKLHGSLDWFDDRDFINRRVALEEIGSARLPRHGVFDDTTRYDARPLVDGLLPDDDLLRNIYRIHKVDDYYERGGSMNAPFLLSPSHVKFVYAEPLLSLWSGMGKGGGLNLGVSVIGFSLPEHDQYIRVGLYQMISNFQQSWWNEPLFGFLKDYVRLVDFRPDAQGIAAYEKSYRFVDAARTKYFFNGLCNDAIDFLFHEPRNT